MTEGCADAWHIGARKHLCRSRLQRLSRQLAPQYFETVQFVETGGLTIAYQRDGVGAPLVLVHGAADDSRTWTPQFADLTDEFTLIAWDEPGAGSSSDLPHDFTLTYFADGLAAFLEALNLGPAHLAGVSWGGTVLLELYRRHPAHVATLILMDTYAGWAGSLPAEEVRARVASTQKMLAVQDEGFDPSLAGIFASHPPAEIVPCSPPSRPMSGPRPSASSCRSWPRPISATCSPTSPSPPC